MRLRAISLLAEDLAVAASNDAIQKASARALRYIRTRTLQGKDVNGVEFAPLNAIYAARKKHDLKIGKIERAKGGLRPPKSNLHYTGKLLRSLSTVVYQSDVNHLGKYGKKRGIGFTVFSNMSKKKVKLINDKREFMGITKDEEGLLLRAFSREFRNKLAIESVKRNRG